MLPVCLHAGRGVPGEGQHPAEGQPALHPDGLLPGQGLQHPDQAGEPGVPAGNRTQISGGERESHTDFWEGAVLRLFM